MVWDNEYIFYLIGGVFLTISIYYLIKHRNTTTDTEANIRDVRKKPEENHYSELRSRALSITPDQLNIESNNNKLNVYGVIMEFDIDNAALTVVAFQTGDASIYLSTGQGFIGGIGKDNIKAAALSFVSLAQSFPTKAILTDATPLPQKGYVQFYFLTNRGRYFHSETIQTLSNDWEKLHAYGHNLITQYRISVTNPK